LINLDTDSTAGTNGDVSTGQVATNSFMTRQTTDKGRLRAGRNGHDHGRSLRPSVRPSNSRSITFPARPRWRLRNQ
jgi:hypothetical protein